MPFAPAGGISKQHSQMAIHLCSTSRITSRFDILDLNEFWFYKRTLQLPYLVNVAQEIKFLKLKIIYVNFMLFINVR
jgi:hypothetical protein